ncbi:MAG: TRAP transporter small permease [candidate division NC10 bacterium]|nr:TRAP transporter small permease [candidate division NC10 bacterium]
MNQLPLSQKNGVLFSIEQGMVRAQRVILIVASAFITLLVFGAVLMRYIFKYPGMEVEELATLVAFWLYFTGAIHGTYERTHIKTELIHLVVKKPRAYALVKSVASLITFILAVVMAYWGYTFMMWGIAKWGRSPVLQLPLVYAQSSIFFGAVFMAFYFLVEFVDNVRQTLGMAPVAMPPGME